MIFDFRLPMVRRCSPQVFDWQRNQQTRSFSQSSSDRRNTMKVKNTRSWLAIFLITTTFLNVRAQAAQRDLHRLTVGYTPIAGASLPFFIAVEEKIFQKYGFEVSGIFMGGSPLINSAILAGEFPIGYTGGGAVI